jgi:thioredoxin:protein disulfide reductase
MVVAGAFSVWAWKLTPKQHLPWVVGNEPAAYATARAEGKGVMVDFSATWCTPCEELELTFGDPDVYEAITGSFVPLKLDVTEGDDDDMKKRKRYGADTLPSVVFLDTDGNVLARVNKLIEADEMLATMRPAVKQVRASRGRAQTP